MVIRVLSHFRWVFYAAAFPGALLGQDNWALNGEPGDRYGGGPTSFLDVLLFVLMIPAFLGLVYLHEKRGWWAVIAAVFGFYLVVYLAGVAWRAL